MSKQQTTTLPEEYRLYTDFASLLLKVLVDNPSAIDQVHKGKKNWRSAVGLISKIHRTLNLHYNDHVPIENSVITEYWAILNSYVYYVLVRYCKTSRYALEMEKRFKDQLKMETKEMTSYKSLTIEALIIHCNEQYDKGQARNINVLVAIDTLGTLIPKTE